MLLHFGDCFPSSRSATWSVRVDPGAHFRVGISSREADTGG